MTIATSSSTTRRSLLRPMPLLAAALATIALVLLAIGPLGWRAGWWNFRFALQTLMPWAGYFGIAALSLSGLALLLGRSRIEWHGVAIAVAAFAAGGLIAYVPWHYDHMRNTVPPIHDITTDADNPPAFAAAAAARTAEGGNSVVYEGGKIAVQQHSAYPDIGPANLAMGRPDAFNRALDTARGMGWTIVAVDEAAGRIEASDKSRWFGFIDDIVIRVAATGSTSRVDIRSSSRLGRSDFGVNATRIRAFLAALRGNTGGQG
jgi:uncharacterized protein (DUF1499 family)